MQTSEERDSDEGDSQGRDSGYQDSYYREAPDAVNNRGVGDRAHPLRDYLADNYDRLYRRLLRHLGCPDQARDSLHDAWLRLSEMTAVADVTNLEAYVYRVACNLAMDRHRSAKASQYVDETESGLDALADPSPGPAHIAEARSDLAAVERAIRTLPLRHQEVLTALRVDERERSDVAATCGVSLRRIDRVLREALDHLHGSSCRIA